MTLVVDASVVVAAFTETGPLGAWALDLVEGAELVAPAQLPAECANVLTRLESYGNVDRESAQSSFRELGRLAIAYQPFGPVADRVWDLRFSVTSYDAWYVAVAEAFGVPLATLDRKLIGANGPRCEFITAS